MRKLMRKLFILSALGLALAATPNQPSRAEEVVLVSSDCTAAQIALVAAGGVWMGCHQGGDCAAARAAYMAAYNYRNAVCDGNQ